MKRNLHGICTADVLSGHSTFGGSPNETNVMISKPFYNYFEGFSQVKTLWHVYFAVT